jgi:hypothetical protein
MRAPIDKQDWDEVHDLACDIANAIAMEDVILQESKLAGLFRLLDQLGRKYGDHPALLATRADFILDHAEAMKIYGKALEIARRYQDREEEEEILDSIRQREVDQG